MTTSDSTNACRMRATLSPRAGKSMAISSANERSTSRWEAGERSTAIHDSSTRQEYFECLTKRNITHDTAPGGAMQKESPMGGDRMTLQPRGTITRVHGSSQEIRTF